MGARILSFLLGVMLTGIGWAIVDAAGFAGTRLPAFDLGILEGHRTFIGWGVLALGIAALLSAVLPKGDGPGRRKRRTPPLVDFDAAPEPAVESRDAPHAEHTSTASLEDVGPFPVSETAVSPAEPVAAPPPPEPPPRAEPVSDASFAALRDELQSLVRAESWTEAAALARRLPASGTNDEERMVGWSDLGDFARSQGATDQAAEAYETALGYARALHGQKPTDLDAMTALAGVLTGVGDAAQEEARLDAAVEAYEEALDLRRKVVAINRDGQTLRALSLALERLADAREDRGHRVRALDLYRESFDIAGKLAAADPQLFGEDLAVTRRRLTEIEARLAAV